MPQSSRHLRERRNGLCGYFWLAVWKFFFHYYYFLVCTYGHARMATHVRARESEGTACVVVVSGSRFECFLFVCLFARMATNLRACTSIMKWCFCRIRSERTTSVHNTACLKHASDFYPYIIASTEAWRFAAAQSNDMYIMTVKFHLSAWHDHFL